VRELPCPNCDLPIKFSWADFVFLDNWGKSKLFCLGCKKLCTIDSGTTLASLGVSVLPIFGLYLLLFASGLFLPPRHTEAIFVLLSVPVVILLRAIATEKLAQLTPY
jgi:hypothetical protein